MRSISVYFKAYLFIMLLASLLSVSMAAATLNIKYMAGNSGINNYRAVNDNITLNLTSSDSNITVNGNSVICQKYGSYYYQCGWTDVQNSPTVTYAIGNALGDSASATMKVDNSIGSIDFSVAATNGNVTMNYSITDTGYNNGADCSGIGLFEVHANADNINEVDFNYTPGKCAFQGSTYLSITDSGLKEIYVIATDNVGNSKVSVHKNITIDITPPDINTLSVQSMGNDLSTIAQNIDIPVDISFDVTEDNLADITADLSSININPAIKPTYKNIIVAPSSCLINISDNEKKYTCTIKNKVLRINTDDINISVKASDTAGNTKTKVLTKPFTVDNDKPNATITTEHCNSAGKCYLRNGINRINVALTKENFNNRNVYVKVGGGMVRVINCTGNDCYANISISCNTNDFIAASLSTTAPFISMDDSGNRLPASPANFICDNSPPLLLGNISMSGYYSNNGVIYSGIIVSGSQVTIMAKLQDTSDINASVDLDKMKNATENTRCLKNSTTNTFNCTWNIMNIEDGYYDANLHFIFSDIVGNALAKDQKVRVLGFSSDNDTPKSLLINVQKVYPSSINRITLDLASYNKIPYFAYAQYVITAKNAKARLITQKISVSDCAFKNSDTGEDLNSQIFSNVIISNVYANISDVNRIDMTFNSVDVNALPDNMMAYCNVSAYVQEDKIVYKKPQKLVLEIPFSFRNSKLGTPGQVFGEKIKSVSEGFWKKAEIIGIANDWLPKIQRICDLKNYLDMASFAGNVISTVGAAVTPIFGPGLQNGGMAFSVNIQSVANCFNGDPSSTGGIFAQVTNNQPTGTQQANAAIKFGKCPEIVRTMCDFVGCNVAKRLNVSTQPALTDIFSSDIISNGILKNKDVPDVSNSIIMAAATRCWPAVVYNLNKWRQVDCGYLYCLKESSLRGVDISVCDKSKAIQQCSLLVGEVFELPGIVVGKNVLNNIGELINNVGPLAAVSAAKPFCGEYLDPSKAATAVKPFDATKIWLCQIPLQIARFVDGMKRSTRSAQFFYPEVQDMCKLADQCPGPSCTTETSIWTSLANIRLPTYNSGNPATGGRDPNYAAAENKKYTDLMEQRNALVTKLWNSENPADRKAVEDYSKMTPTQLQDYASAKDYAYNTILSVSTNLPVQGLVEGLYTSKYGAPLPTGATAQLADYSVKMMDVQTVAKCGVGLCANVMLRNPDNPNDVRTLTAAELAANPAAQQLRTDQEIEALNKIEAIDNIPADELANMPDPERFNLQIERQSHVKFVNNCPPTSTVGNGCNNIDKTKLTELQQVRSEQNTVKAAQQFGDFIYIGLQILYQNHVLDFMMSANWGDGMMKVVKFFDSSRWVESLCNPDVHVTGGRDDNSGTVISCDTGSCQPVLTMAAEREPIDYANGTHAYLYTIAYYVGPVYIPQGTIVSYRVEFRGQITAKGYRNKLILQNNDIQKVAKAFVHQKMFTKMCIIFDQEFPPKTGAGRKEYCRDIKSVDFNTGTPYVEDQATGFINSGYGTTLPYKVFTGASNEPGVLEQ